MRKFVLRAALRPNQIEFSYSLDPKPPLLASNGSRCDSGTHRVRWRRGRTWVCGSLFDRLPSSGSDPQASGLDRPGASVAISLYFTAISRNASVLNSIAAASISNYPLYQKRQRPFYQP
jgi:hypothetical protein